MSNVEDVPAVPKTEPSREGSFSSQASSPELELDEHTSITENVQVQKRKGGRKPIYATSEERKQRNRQAQAAFRERRTEYIKQLETNIKHQDETLQSLQQSHRAAADECLMLRYKNSLLERILLEKGIDVQEELKTIAAPVADRPGPSAPKPTTVQRAIINQHHNARRSTSGPTHRLLQAQKPSANMVPSQSPQIQPTVPSVTSSPVTSKSPCFTVQGGMISPHLGVPAQQQLQQPQQQQQPPPPRGSTYPPLRPIPGPGLPMSNPNLQGATPNMIGGQRSDGRNGALGTRSTPWPSPYQTHIEQLGKLTRSLLPLFI
ncbi:MAG: hypothetical protein Q9187_005762 [Circinaria calcarea]